MAVDAKEAASGFVAGYPALAYAGFIGLFVLLALTLFPAQLWVIVFGAMLFGFWPGLVLAWTAAVCGAVGVYWAARTVLADRYRAATSKHLSGIEEAFPAGPVRVDARRAVHSGGALSCIERGAGFPVHASCRS